MAPRRTEVLVVGAGFSGLVMALKLKAAGLDFVILEKAADLGGTWRDNTYPGCACDIPSHLYSIAGEPKPDWSRKFAPQAEIWAYLAEVARRRGLMSHIRFGAALRSAKWDEEQLRWRVAASDGQVFEARTLVMGVGALHLPSVPPLPGLDRFEGAHFHSARWRHDVPLEGQRIAVIGAGASAIQFTPQIAPAAAQVDVYQRTAPWVLPRRDRAFGPLHWRIFRFFPPARRLYRALLFARQELRHRLMGPEGGMSRAAEKLARRHMAEHIRDPELRAALTPSYRIGCKRVLLSDDWYPTLARANVEVVTAPIAEVRARSIVDTAGVERPTDVIVFGTGFAATEAYRELDVTGRGGAALRELWKDGMTAALGTTVRGLPNLFFLLGPNTGLGHNSVVLMIEAQAGYVLRRLQEMKARGLGAIEVRQEVQAAFAAEMEDRLAASVWQSGGCRSWYQDARGRNTTLWPGGVREFQRRLAAAGLEDFELTPLAGR